MKLACLVIAVACMASVMCDECEEAKFWKALIVNELAPNKMRDCNDVVTTVQLARQFNCLNLVPPAVCSFAQEKCPGIACGVTFDVMADVDPMKSTKDLGKTAAGTAHDIAHSATQGAGTIKDQAKQTFDDWKKSGTKTGTGIADKASREANKIAKDGTQVIQTDVTVLTVKPDTIAEHKSSGPRPVPAIFLIAVMLGVVGLVALSAYRTHLRSGYRVIGGLDV